MATQRPRILHVISSANLEGGGPIEGLRQLSQALKAEGVDVEAATFDPPDAAYLQKVPFPVHPLGPSKLGTFGYCPKLKNWVAKHGAEYDRIVVNGLWQYNGVAVYTTRKQHKRPYFVFCHGMMDSWFRKRYPLKHLKKQIFWWLFQGPVLKHAQKVLFTSEEERVQSHNGFSPYHLVEQVVQYGTAGLPPHVKDAEPFFAQHEDLRGKRFLLYLSRIHVKKGCDLLINAFAKIATEDPELDLVFAGPDQTNWRPQLEKMAADLGIANRIHWLGMVTGDMKWQAFLAAEAFVLPSHQENFGIAVAEALSAHLSVLISNKINIWREIDGAGAGIIEPDDQEGTDQLLRRWVRLSPEQRQKLRSNARPCFEENFEIRKAARTLINVYGLTPRD